MNSFEPTEDMPQMYFQDTYPIYWRDIEVICFTDDGKAYALHEHNNDWYETLDMPTQEEAISFYENFGWGSKVL
jgi:hypothetical protein